MPRAFRSSSTGSPAKCAWQIFVAVLGASSFTFAWASWTQSLPDWIDAHLALLRRSAAFRSFWFDNTKTAIVNSCFYDPQVNRTYADMAAAHHGAALLPGGGRSAADHSRRRDFMQERAHRRASADERQPPALCRLDRRAHPAGSPQNRPPATAALCEQILEARPHPEPGYLARSAARSGNIMAARQAADGAAARR